MTLYGRGRDIEEIEKAVTFDVTSCLWRIVGDANEVHRSDERSAIIAVLRDAKEPLKAMDIADRADLLYSSMRMTLSRMVKSQEIRRVGRGRYISAAEPAVTTVTTVTSDRDEASPL